MSSLYIEGFPSRTATRDHCRSAAAAHRVGVGQQASGQIAAGLGRNWDITYDV